MGVLERLLSTKYGPEAVDVYQQAMDAGVDISRVTPYTFDKAVAAVQNPGKGIEHTTIFRNNALEALDTPQEPLPRYQPLPRHAENDVTRQFPERMNTIMRDVAKGAEMGAGNWYDNADLLREFQHYHGDEKGALLFDQHMRGIAATSSGKPVPQNIKQASALEERLMAGELPDVRSYGEALEFLQENPGYLPQGAGGVTQNNDIFLYNEMVNRPDYHRVRALEAGSPQKIASFAEGLRGNRRPVTFDRHEARRLNTPMQWVADQGKFQARPLTTNEYIAAEPYYQSLADLLSAASGKRIDPANLQGMRWIGGRKKTGVKSMQDTFMREYEDTIQKAAANQGRTPEEVKKEHILHGLFLQ